MSLLSPAPSCFSPVWLFVTPWTTDHQAPLSMGFPRQEYCSGLSFPSPGDLSDPGMELAFLTSPALAGGFSTTGPPLKSWVKVSVAQLFLTLCDPMDYVPPGSSVHGILQEEYWSGQSFSSPADLPNPGIEPRSPALQEDSLQSKPP